jgi:hypothetical protein
VFVDKLLFFIFIRIHDSSFETYIIGRASPSEFVIPLSKYIKAVYHTRVSVGMRFRMLFETEESSVRRYLLPYIIFSLTYIDFVSSCRHNYVKIIVVMFINVYERRSSNIFS